MNRREFMKGMTTGLLSAAMAPELLAHCVTRNFPILPASVSDDFGIRISIVGVGQTGARMVGILSRSLTGIYFHEVMFDPERENLMGMHSLFASVRKSDLLFILSGFEDAYSDSFVTAIAEIARNADVLTVAVVPESDDLKVRPSQSPENGILNFDSLISVSEMSLAGGLNLLQKQLFQPGTLTEYAMRHSVTVIVNLIRQHGLICIDFADVASVLKTGKRGKLAVGSASREMKYPFAAKLALERLVIQGTAIPDVDSALVCVSGSSLLTMDDFAEVSAFAADAFSENAEVIVGLVVEEQMGNNIRVSIFAMRNQAF